MGEKTVVLGLVVFMSFAGSASAQEVGRFATSAGLSVPKIDNDDHGKASAHMDNKPYSASYLSKQEGNLSKNHDVGVEKMITDGFGDCDLVHDIVKENAKKASSAKLDAAVKNAEGVDAGVTDEYNRTGVDPNAQHWEGFCHLWAPAGLDPAAAFVVSLDKIYANVPFGIGDLKELTTWSYPRPASVFVGKRNYGTKDAADVLDPMDLIATLETYVGPGKPGVVFDVDPSAEVWNQAIYSYDRTTEKLKGDAAQGGPEGSKAYLVKLHAQYAKEAPNHEFASRIEPYLLDLNWQAKVWTDKKGNVVKTEWVAGGDPIPDFAWAPVHKYDGANFTRLQKIAKDGVSVKDIQSFCEGMQKMTKDSFKHDKKALAGLLEKICPVLDQNHVSDYIAKTAARTGIDASELESALRGPGNS